PGEEGGPARRAGRRETARGRGGPARGHGGTLSGPGWAIGCRHGRPAAPGAGLGGRPGGACPGPAAPGTRARDVPPQRPDGDGRAARAGEPAGGGGLTCNLSGEGLKAFPDRQVYRRPCKNPLPNWMASGDALIVRPVSNKRQQKDVSNDLLRTG